MARSPKTKPDAPEAETVDNEKPRYRVIEKSFIGHVMVEEGAEITYEGTPVADNLSPLNEAAQRVVDTQKDAHLDKTDGEGALSPRRAADAAAAGVTGAGTGGTDDLA